MAHAERSEVGRAGLPSPPAVEDHGYDPGGPVAYLQADLARRFLTHDEVHPPTLPGASERIVRFVSLAGGYLALFAAYAAAAVLILR